MILKFWFQDLRSHIILKLLFLLYYHESLLHNQDSSEDTHLYSPFLFNIDLSAFDSNDLFWLFFQVSINGNRPAL